MLVSDGYGFAVSDADGRYTLELNAKAKTIYVQRNDRFTADITKFWHRLTPGRSQYDFLLQRARPVVGDSLDIVVVGDSETHQLEFMEPIRRYLGNHPEVDLFVHAGDISAQSPLGMEAHREFVNAATLGRPVVYACGNHDVDFRGKGFYGDHDPFLALYGPWWESFELGGFLFVVIPIYNSWGAPLVYDMLDCGDWLKELCRRYPDKRKVLIAHDLPDLVGYRMATRTGDVVLDDERFVCAIYGHKHMNIVRKYPSGRKAFCVAAPNKGGAGCFAPSYRVVHLDRATGQAQSELLCASVREHLALIAPNGQLRLEAGDRLVIAADAYDGGDEVVGVTATAPGLPPVDLAAQSAVAWSAQAAWQLSGETRVTLTAHTRSGREFSRDFTVEIAENRLAWLTQLSADIAMCDLQLVNNLLIVGVCDDANGEKGGIYALDPATGAIVWHYSTGYGVRNNIATDGVRLYAIDTRANIHAVDAATGQPCWINPSDSNIVSPSASAVACSNGMVVGGYGRHLRGIRAEDGAVLWRNTAWQVEERTPAEDKLAVDGDGRLLVISRLNGLYCHDLWSGVVLWQYRALFANGTALPDGRCVWLVGGAGNLLCLDRATGKLVQEIKPYPCQGATAVPVKLANGLLLVASGNQGLGAFDPAAGKDRWRFRPQPAIFPTADYATGHPASVTATPLVDGEWLWMAANDGCVYQLNPLDGKIMRSFSVGLPILGRPCANAERLYVADCCGRVMAITK